MNIKQLLQLEYAKWRQNSVISILALLYVVMLPVALVLATEIRDFPPPISSNQTFFIFPTVWDWLGYVGNWLSFFCLGLISIFMIVNEVSYKTFRQNIITGLTKKEFFIGKLSAMAAVAAAGTLYYALIALLSGFFNTSSPDIGFAFDNSWAISRFFLMTMGYMTIGMFIGLAVRRSGVSVLIYLIYLLMIEPAIKWGVHFKLLDINNNSANYYPGNVFEDLMPFPLMRLPQALSGMQEVINFDVLLPYTNAVIASIIWIAIMLFGGYKWYLRRDM